MEEVAAVPPVLAGSSQASFCRPVAPERRTRKSGSANIFQGLNLRQLRRLFHSAGEPDAEHRARLVCSHWRGPDQDQDQDLDQDQDQDEERLAQALVGLRVRARNRSGIRAEPHRGDTMTTTRTTRVFGHTRLTERSAVQVPKAVPDDDDDDDDGDEAALGACGGQDPLKTRSCDSGDFVYKEEEEEEEEEEEVKEEEVRGSWSRNGSVEKDPERYLHRIRH